MKKYLSIISAAAIVTGMMMFSHGKDLDSKAFDISMFESIYDGEQLSNKAKTTKNFGLLIGGIGFVGIISTFAEKNNKSKQ